MSSLIDYSRWHACGLETVQALGLLSIVWPRVCNASMSWYWDRTRDQASHDPIPIPLGYRGHVIMLGIGTEDPRCGEVVHIKSVRAPYVDVIWKLGDMGAGSGVILIS
ncbi:hypothetical protein TNCV_2516221 [Trichonephila clavipes]|nr:hypothetical protein TNCV_2516221 [Trichonephila clavipes]